MTDLNEKELCEIHCEAIRYEYDQLKKENEELKEALKKPSEFTNILIRDKKILIERSAAYQFEIRELKKELKQAHDNNVEIINANNKTVNEMDTIKMQYNRNMLDYHELNNENERLQKLNSDLTAKCDYLEKENQTNLDYYANERLRLQKDVEYYKEQAENLLKEVYMLTPSSNQLVIDHAEQLEKLKNLNLE
jgi:hypothetical protein